MVSLSSLLGGDKDKSAGVAKERLQIILALERASQSSARPDYLNALQHELVEVVSRFVNIDPKDIKVHLERQNSLEVLEVKVELPDTRTPGT